MPKLVSTKIKGVIEQLAKSSKFLLISAMKACFPSLLSVQLCSLFPSSLFFFLNLSTTNSWKSKQHHRKFRNKLIMGNESRRLLLLLIFLLRVQLRVNSVIGICEHSFNDGSKLYNFSLASPLPKFPHGILSEDG